MKLSCYLILALALLSSCKQTNNGRAGLSHTLTEAYDPSLLSLQFQTVEIKRVRGKWAESKSDYVNAFGDSASAVLADFEFLSYRDSNDTLIISYILKEPRRKVNPVIEFVDLEASEDSSKLKFDSSVQQIKNNSQFKLNEGKLTFFRTNEHAISIIHEYHGGAAKHKITHAQH